MTLAIIWMGVLCRIDILWSCSSPAIASPRHLCRINGAVYVQLYIRDRYINKENYKMLITSLDTFQRHYD